MNGNDLEMERVSITVLVFDVMDIGVMIIDLEWD